MALNYNRGAQKHQGTATNVNKVMYNGVLNLVKKITSITFSHQNEYINCNEGVEHKIVGVILCICSIKVRHTSVRSNLDYFK